MAFSDPDLALNTMRTSQIVLLIMTHPQEGGGGCYLFFAGVTGQLSQLPPTDTVMGLSQKH